MKGHITIAEVRELENRLEAKGIRLRIIRALRSKGGAVSDNKWRPIKTIPSDVPVIVKTVRGLIRRAKVRGSVIIREGSPIRVSCWRDEPGCNPAYLSAIAWKPE